MGTQLAARLENLEAAEALGRLVEDLDAVDPGAPWALAAEGDHRLDRLRLPFEYRLDRSVGPVADPAGGAAGGGLAAHRVAEEDPLHAPVDDHSPANTGNASSRSLGAGLSPSATTPDVSGGTKTVAPRKPTEFRIKLQKPVLRRLGRIAPRGALKAKITASATELSGRTENEHETVRLRGRKGGESRPIPRRCYPAGVGNPPARHVLSTARNTRLDSG